MKQEPVAWLVEGYDGIGSHIRTVVSSKPKPDSWVTVTPLYTAPRELSDEEITFLWHQSMNLAISDENLKNNVSHATIFAKAVLKKAIEK